MDDTQRVTVAICMIGIVVLGLGSFLYVNEMNEQRSKAEADYKLDFAICSLTMKDVRGLSLVLSNKSVKRALKCAEDHVEFRAFKDLYDERSPNSPTRRSYDPQYWPDFP